MHRGSSEGQAHRPVCHCCWTRPRSRRWACWRTHQRPSQLRSDKQKFLGDGVVTGYGTIDARAARVRLHRDFTVLAGAWRTAHAQKIRSGSWTWPCVNGAPSAYPNDSGRCIDPGGRGDPGRLAPTSFYRKCAQRRGSPVISAILGPRAGGAAYSPALTDFAGS